MSPRKHDRVSKNPPNGSWGIFKSNLHHPDPYLFKIPPTAVGGSLNPTYTIRTRISSKSPQPVGGSLNPPYTILTRISSRIPPTVVGGSLNPTYTSGPVSLQNPPNGSWGIFKSNLHLLDPYLFKNPPDGSWGILKSNLHHPDPYLFKIPPTSWG